MGSFYTLMPAQTSVLVIGGGPGGSYTATLLARDGFEVTLIERAHFPRYHVGESLLPSARKYLSLIGAEELVQSQGQTVKPGAAFKLNMASRESYTSFVEIDPGNATWNVVRSEFDDILLKHAATSGVSVFEGVEVTGIEFHEKQQDRPVAALWEDSAGSHGKIQFDWLVDASGRAGLLSSRYLKSRRFNSSMKNVAYWAYWSGSAIYASGTVNANSPYFEALTDQSGWGWHIPLHDGTVSVGFVISETSNKLKQKDAMRGKSIGAREGATELYLSQLQFTPYIAHILQDADLYSAVKIERDYSYSAPTYSGDHFRIVGDAGAFIDPLFSSGVHLAFTSALSAACTIAASSRGMCTEHEANTFHDLKFGTAYTRFMLLVLGVYKQIRAQSEPVLGDVDEKTFDRAFALLRPVIQGSAEFETTLTEAELQKAMDFFTNMFPPIDWVQRHEVKKRVDPELFSNDSPFLLPEQVDKIVGPEDREAAWVLNTTNILKSLRDVFEVEGQVGREVYAGYVLTCARGRLGLASVDDSSA